MISVVNVIAFEPEPETMTTGVVNVVCGPAEVVAGAGGAAGAVDAAGPLLDPEATTTLVDNDTMVEGDGGTAMMMPFVVVAGMKVDGVAAVEAETSFGVVIVFIGVVGVTIVVGVFGVTIVVGVFGVAIVVGVFGVTIVVGLFGVRFVVGLFGVLDAIGVFGVSGVGIVDCTAVC